MSNLQPPAFLKDLYADLRERRLLPVVIVLIVAIVAVPVALSAGSDAPAPAATTAPASSPHAKASAPAADPAVLVEGPRLRDYRKRLADLRADDPFNQKFEFSGLERTRIESGSGVVGGDVTSVNGGGAAGGGTVGGSTGSAAAAPSVEPQPDRPRSAPPSEPKPRVEVERIVRLVTHRADVRFGPAGELETRKDVKALTVLEPVAVFAGVSEDGSKALFLLSAELTDPLGGGKCLSLSGSSCGLLVLEKGQRQTLKNPLSGESYVLELLAVRRATVG